MSKNNKNYKKGAIFIISIYTLALSYLNANILENDAKEIEKQIDKQDETSYSPNNLVILKRDNKIDFLKSEKYNKTIYLSGITDPNIKIMITTGYCKISNFINIGKEEITNYDLDFDTKYLLEDNKYYTEEELKEIKNSYNGENVLQLTK